MTNTLINRKLILPASTPLLLVLLLLSACGGNASANTATTLEVASEEQLPESNVVIEESVVAEQNVAETRIESEVEISGDGNTSGGENTDTASSESGVQARVAPEFSLGDPQMKSSPAGNFDRSTGEVQVLEFFAYWCPNCKALAPQIHGLEAAYEGEVEFTFLDIDDPINQALEDEFGFYYQPFVLVIDGEGHVHKSWVGGGIDPYEIQAEIERLIEAQG